MAKSTPSTEKPQSGIEIPDGARAVLVSRNVDGSYRQMPVSPSSSVLDLHTELLNHLNEYPYSDEWLIELRDFVEAKLQARQSARKVDGFVTPLPTGRGFAIINNFPLVRGHLEVAT